MVDAEAAVRAALGAKLPYATRRLEGIEMSRERHSPIRMCLMCGERRPKDKMLRIVRTPDGAVRLDEGARINGRGCYICAELAKFNAKEINGKIKRALNLKGDVPPELVKSLEMRTESS